MTRRSQQFFLCVWVTHSNSLHEIPMMGTQRTLQKSAVRHCAFRERDRGYCWRSVLWLCCMSLGCLRGVFTTQQFLHAPLFHNTALCHTRQKHKLAWSQFPRRWPGRQRGRGSSSACSSVNRRACSVSQPGTASPGEAHAAAVIGRCAGHPQLRRGRRPLSSRPRSATTPPSGVPTRSAAHRSCSCPPR